VLYATTTDFFSQGDLHVMDLEGNILSTTAVGVSPGNMALDIRLSTGIRTASGIALGLFPNPAVDHVTITGIQGHAAVRVLDTQGRIVLERSITATGQRVELPIAPLPSGLYTVEVMGQRSLRYQKP